MCVRKNNRFSLSCRFPAIFVSVCFILSESLLYGAPLSVKAASPPSPLTGIQVPPEYGTLEASFQGPTGKTLIYIQDAHDSLEAQENIAKLIPYFVAPLRGKNRLRRRL